LLEDPCQKAKQKGPKRSPGEVCYWKRNAHGSKKEPLCRSVNGAIWRNWPIPEKPNGGEIVVLSRFLNDPKKGLTRDNGMKEKELPKLVSGEKGSPIGGKSVMSLGEPCKLKALPSSENL